MARPFKTSSLPLDDEAQTRFIPRALLVSSPPSERPRSGGRAPVFDEDRTRVDVPRPADDDERTIVAPLAFPKAATRLQMPADRRSTVIPPPPSAASLSSSRSPLPELLPPPPPSSPRLVEGLEATPLHGQVPSEHPSSPALVRDVIPSTPPPSPGGLTRRREPMLLLAGGLGILGVIFTLGILVGLVVALRASPSASVAAASGRAAVTLTSSPMAKVTAKKVLVEDGPADTLAAVAPPPAPPPEVEPPAPAVARVYRPASAPIAAASKPPSPAKHPAAAADVDFDAANAASDLAKAQLDASLR